eukprot:366417-Chlamydomonas_euryale.AAC.20
MQLLLRDLACDKQAQYEFARFDDAAVAGCHSWCALRALADVGPWKVPHVQGAQRLWLRAPQPMRKQHTKSTQ